VKKAESPSTEPSLEQALGRLEEIVGEIEKTPPPLETLIDRYEEGMKLLRACRERLDAAEKRIEIIGRDAGGNAVLKPFEEE
jgi:exodeoxyribonuclease VII small subunit